jgi:glucose/arabinose dehydrogenase
MPGLALAPDFAKSGLARLNCARMDGGEELHKVTSCERDAQAKKLSDPKDVLVGIPAGSDCQGGRLAFGPDGSLRLTKGELGRDQGGDRRL